MAKSKARARRKRLGNSRSRRRSNPQFGFGRTHHRARRHHRRRRQNPMGVNFRDTGGQLLWGTGGAVVTLAVPGFLPQFNTGWMGIGMNAVTAFLGGTLVGKMAGQKAGQDFLVGGVIATGLRIFNKFFGPTLLSDLGTGGGNMGFYLQNSFPLPTAGTGPFLLNDGYSASVPMASVAAPAQAAAVLPAAAAPAAAAGGAGDEPSRWSKWTA